MPDSLTTDSIPSAAERTALLQKAAKAVDAQSSHLGPGDPNPEPTPDGDILRKLTEDQATLSEHPEVYPITDSDFLDKGRPAPVKLVEMMKDHRFFWVRFPVGLMPRPEWRFNGLALRAEFNPGAPGAERPRTHDTLPKREFQTLLETTTHAEVEFDADFKLKAKEAVAGAAAGAEAAGGTGAKLSAGPFHYRISKALIDNSGTGLEWVQWRLDGGKFFAEDRPDLVAMVKVPRQTTQFRISAALEVRRNVRLLSGSIWGVLMALATPFKTFFQDGAPLRDVKHYDLDSHLAGR